MSQTRIGRQISVSEMAPHVHSFLPNENKVNKISAWLSGWIKKSLKENKIKPFDFLPAKGDLAFHIGVSLGTMQNAFRILEDNGLVESKQRVGTCIKGSDSTSVEKLTSKRENTCEIIKRYIIDNNIKKGDVLISIRKLSELIKIPSSTIRTAINTLIIDGILAKKNNVFIINSLDFKVINKEPETLVEKTAGHINDYIKKYLKSGEKLPSNSALADMLNVSIKTIHDAIKILSAADIVRTKRGYYGTIVADKNIDKELYFYEQVEQSIKKYIAENCKVNDKLPSIKNFAEVFNVSAKTIKKALDNLAQDGYISYARGRYGGTFVIDVPTEYEQGYTWLALSPEFERIN